MAENNNGPASGLINWGKKLYSLGKSDDKKPVATDKADTSWHDKQVSEVNDMFRKRAEEDKAKKKVSTQKTTTATTTKPPAAKQVQRKKVSGK